MPGTYPDVEVTPGEVTNDAPIIAEFLDYLRQLAEEWPEDIPPHIPWQLYQEGVRRGRHWAEVTEELGLPEPTW